MGRFDAALQSYAQALARGVSRPEEAHLNRAVIFADCLRREAEAERELEAALALNPAYPPALQNLANLYEDLGRREEALDLYERILESGSAGLPGSGPVCAARTARRPRRLPG